MVFKEKIPYAKQHVPLLEGNFPPCSGILKKFRSPKAGWLFELSRRVCEPSVAWIENLSDFRYGASERRRSGISPLVAEF